MTNGDKIRAMTDEELASFFDRVTRCCSDGFICSDCPLNDSGDYCDKDELARFFGTEAKDND